MKRLLLTLCLVVVIGLIIISIRKSRESIGPHDRDATVNIESSEPPAGEPPQQRTHSPVHPMAASIGSTNIPAEKEPEILLEMLQAWRRQTGTFPTAEDNRQLVSKLIGNNEDQLRLFPASHARISATGELIDGWGSPFVFHHVSSHYLEIRSAGPDRTVYTADDIVVPKQPDAN
jgi:hypothetical protein